MAGNAYPVGGSGGIMSDVMTSPQETRRSIKVSSGSPLDAATESGSGYGCSFMLNVAAGQTLSIRIIANAQYVLRFIRAKGLFFEYYDGDASGDLTELASALPLNMIRNDGFEATVEVRNGHPTGNRVVSGVDEITEAFFVGTGGAIEICNISDTDFSGFVALGIQSYSTPVTPFGLLSDTQLESNTEMGNYNG